MMTINVCGMGKKRPDLCTVLDRKKPVIVGIQETLLNRPDRRLWLPNYTTIESKMVDEDGSRGLALAVRKGSGLLLSELESDRNFVAGAIEGLTESREHFAMLVVSVYIPCSGPSRQDSLDRLCRFVNRELEKNVFSEVVFMGDWNAVPSQTHRHLLARGLSPHEEFLRFRRATRFSRPTATRGRCIDYFVSLKGALVGKQVVCRGIDLSDHYPVLSAISCPHLKAEPEPLVYDRKALSVKGGAADRILRDERWLECVGEDGKTRADLLEKLVKELSLEYNILRARKARKVIPYSKATRKAIEVRRFHFKSHRESGYNWD